ncbi:MAG: superoxide dismutase family protein [Acidimicrobiia bacterium]|nr:superoxide dismutase family protein [Acidimicrobiia bacterium]
MRPATDFRNVGAHWSPSGVTHGSHEGDLVPILVDAHGRGDARSTTRRFEPSELAGRAVILHVWPDNLANVRADMPPVHRRSPAPMPPRWRRATPAVDSPAG